MSRTRARASRGAEVVGSSGSDAARQRAAGRRTRGARELRAVARRRHLPALPVRRRGLCAGRRRRESRTRGCGSSRLASSPCSACRCSPAAISPTTTARDSELVVIVSQSVAQRLFPERRRGESAAVVDRCAVRQAQRRAASSASSRTWTTRTWCRGPALTIYHPFQQMAFAGRLFVHASGDPYALVPAVTRIIREMSADQPVERAATLEDVRAEVLAPERLNAFVLVRIRRRRAAHRGGRRRGRAGVLGERAHARVRRAAGGRLVAASAADAGAGRRRR